MLQTEGFAKEVRSISLRRTLWSHAVKGVSKHCRIKTEGLLCDHDVRHLCKEKVWRSLFLYGRRTNRPYPVKEVRRINGVIRYYERIKTGGLETNVDAIPNIRRTDLRTYLYGEKSSDRPYP